MKNLNPEKNKKVRAYLFVLGLGGTIHLLLLLFSSILYADKSILKEFYSLDFDDIFPWMPYKPAMYFLGWGVFIAAIILTYKWLSRENNRSVD